MDITTKEQWLASAQKHGVPIPDGVLFEAMTLDELRRWSYWMSDARKYALRYNGRQEGLSRRMADSIAQVALKRSQKPTRRYRRK